MKVRELQKQNVIEREVEQDGDSVDITLYENSESLSTVWMRNEEVIEESTQ
ncbi:hypothetical protein [Viridibacillus arvi]|uniref:hypothetical protein n=1 Tax=Viridibacillus arvi TaxID=263475 RepID=UPI00187B4BFC|nr:hypothetical protein [Viridibacillus sp. JNUCC-6]QOV10425.1 hypothetical protein JNUCC6_17835 [Viridibacillus sp. JNUCC-6]